MLTNNQTAWGGMYVNKDGSPKEKEIREILGYEEVELGGREYLIHMKPRLGNELKDMTQGITATDAEIKGQAPEDLQLKLDSIERKANRWMLTNNQTAWGGMYVNKDGSPKEKEIREILGYEEVELGGREYLIHMKPRLGNELKDMAQGITATDAEIKGQAPEDLQLKLDSIERKTESEVDFAGHFIDKGGGGFCWTLYRQGAVLWF